MPNEDKNIGGSLVLDLRIWWRHVKTLYRADMMSSLAFPTSFPGSLFSSSLGRWNKDPGRGWSRDHLWHKFFHRGRVNE